MTQNTDALAIAAPMSFVVGITSKISYSWPRFDVGYQIRSQALYQVQAIDFSRTEANVMQLSETWISLVNLSIASDP